MRVVIKSLIFVICILSVMGAAVAYALPNYVWLEGENATVTNGIYAVKNNVNASGGKIITMDSVATSASDELSLPFQISETTSYDVWVLSTQCNATYVSRYKWALDTGTYTNSTAIGGETIFKTGDSRNTDMKWYKLSSQSISSGSHTFKILCDVKREMVTQFYYHSLDTVAIVPTSWSWTPSLLSTPYDINGLDVQYVSGSISSQTANADGSITVNVTNKLLTATAYDATIFAELRLNGETVSKTTITPTTAIKNWQLGTNYSNSILLNIPFNVPSGNYEVVTGVECAYSALKKTSFVEDLQIGNYVAPPEILAQEVKEISLPTNINSGGNIQGSVKIKALQSVDFDTTAYLEFWKDGLLWAVEEAGDIATSEWTINNEYISNINSTVDQALPAGTYEVKIGLHQLKTIGISCYIDITSTFENNKTYKPLANGRYLDKKSGTTHLWYVNQNHTLIWDGEPYIPAGGMFCSEYATRFDVNNPTSNRIRWNRDVAVLQTLKDKGITDLYINPESSLDCATAWAWQYLLDYLDNNGFKYGLQLNAGSNEATLTGYYIRANEAVATIKSAMIYGNTTATASMANTKLLGTITDTSAVYAVVNSTTGAVVKSGSATMVKGDTTSSFSATITGLTSGTYYVYFTPKVSFSGSTVTNFWDNEDTILNRISTKLSKLNTGAGFRLCVDPVLNESQMANQLESFRPYSTLYNSKLAIWLQNKYSTITNLNTAWKTTTSIPSFDEASKIIPIYTAQKGTTNANSAFFINPATYVMYTVDIKNGVLWDDCIDFRDYSFRDFNNEVADTIKAYADLPVILKHVSYLNKFNINDQLSGGFDGIGCEGYGDLIGVRHDMNFSRSEAEQFKKTAWYIVTETELDENVTQKYNSGVIGYPDKETMFRHFNNLFDYGAKGFYDFLFYENISTPLSAYLYTSKPVMFDWLKEYRNELYTNKNIDTIVNNYYGPKPYYVYPSSPAWWYSPNKRTAVLYGDDYKTLRSAISTDGRLYSQTNDCSIDTDALIVSLEDAPATTIYGSEINTKLAVLLQKESVIIMGHRNNLGVISEIDKYFTSTKKTLTNGDIVQILNPPVGAEILYKTTDNLPWAFRYGNLWIFANNNWYGVSNDIASIRYIDLFDFTPTQNKLVLKRPIYRTIDNSIWASPQIGSNACVLYFDNNSTNVINCDIIAVIKNDGKLVNVKSVTTSIASKSIDVKKEIQIVIPDDGKNYSVEYYAFNSLTGVKPLSFAQ